MTQELIGLQTLKHRFAVFILTAFSANSLKNRCTSPLYISVGLKAICDADREGKDAFTAKQIDPAAAGPFQSRNLHTHNGNRRILTAHKDASGEGKLRPLAFYAPQILLPESSKNLPCICQIGAATGPYSDEPPAWPFFTVLHRDDGCSIESWRFCLSVGGFHVVRYVSSYSEQTA